MKKFPFFFFEFNRHKSRGATKKHLRAFWSKRHVKIFFSLVFFFFNDEFGLITTHKKVKQRVLYTEWIIQTDARFRVVVIV